MQLGSRWQAGSAPHRGVPEALLQTIQRAEHSHVSGDSWTLTWLEGLPRVELLDRGATVLHEIRLDAAGRVRESDLEDDTAANEGSSGSLEDNDDDWLS